MPYAKSHPFTCHRCGNCIPVGGWYFWSNALKKAFHEKTPDGKGCVEYHVGTKPYPGKKGHNPAPAVVGVAAVAALMDEPHGKPSKGLKVDYPAKPANKPVMAPDPAGEAISTATVEGEALTGTGGPDSIQKHVYREAMSSVTSLYVLQEVGQALIARGYAPNATTADLPDTLYPMLARFWSFKADYERTLARNFFDYLTVACVGELRHADWLAFPGGKPVNRHDAYRKSLTYDPRTILPAAAKAFNGGKWGGSFGGKKWGKIAQSAALYFKFRQHPLVFADHVVDLAHNGGIAFNKGYLVHLEHSDATYLKLLDRKRVGGLLDWQGQTLKVDADVWAVCSPIIKHLAPKYVYRSDPEQYRQHGEWSKTAPVDYSRNLPAGPQQAAAFKVWCAEYRAWLADGAARGLRPGERGNCELVKVSDGIRILATIETVPSRTIAPLAWGDQPFTLNTKTKGAISESQATAATVEHNGVIESYPEPRAQVAGKIAQSAVNA